MIICAVNSVRVATPSSNDKSFINEESKYFVSNDCIDPVFEIFSLLRKFSISCFNIILSTLPDLAISPSLS